MFFEYDSTNHLPFSSSKRNRSLPHIITVYLIPVPPTFVEAARQTLISLIEIVILNGEKKIHLLGRNLCHFLNENKVTFSSIKSFSDKLIKRIAENLKQAREERRLGIGEISALLSIDESTYMSYETGNVIITIGQLQNIADQLNVSVNDLLNM